MVLLGIDTAPISSMDSEALTVRFPPFPESTVFTDTSPPSLVINLLVVISMFPELPLPVDVAAIVLKI